MPAQRLLILAESGSGKSTSIETLDPKETFIINVAGKGLPFAGWRKKYKEWSKDNPSGNLYSNSDPKSILACMDYVNAKRPEIKTLVVDDLFYMSAFELFDKMNEKGYDKFTSIAYSLKQAATKPQLYRDDLCVVFLTHPDESTDLEGKRIIKTKLTGRMVEQQLNFEGLFEIVLYGRAKKTKTPKGDTVIEYGFETKTDGVTPAKSPKGMFTTEFIPNDLLLVKASIEKFEN